MWSGLTKLKAAGSAHTDTKELHTIKQLCAHNSQIYNVPVV